MPEEFLEFELTYQKELAKTVRIPSRIKIDSYLEKYKKLEYIYDFGDDWHINVDLEDIINDYRKGYPTLTDGAQNAPPEDVGGLYGYYDFLKVLSNPSHPDYEHLAGWAKEQSYREYNSESINQFLTCLAYKRNERQPDN